MDERTEVSAAYALRLAADLLAALVASGVMPKAHATTMIDDGLRSMLASHAVHEPELRQIAATLTAQVQLVALEVERKTRD